MKSLKSIEAVVLMLLVSACGGTVELGGPPDGGGTASGGATTGGNTSASATTGGNTVTGGTTSGSGGSGTTGGNTVTGGSTSASGAGGATGGTTTTSGSGGRAGAGGASGSGGSGAGGSPICSPMLAIKCPANMFCDFDLNQWCGGTDTSGVCKPIPTGACLADCPGVCGCDGKFYCNECGAHSNGVDVSPSTACLIDAGVAKACGGVAGVQCDANSFCDFGPVDHCGIPDNSGVCVRRPTVCPLDCRGVCGCDGKIYCNECAAHSAGVDIYYLTSCLRDAGWEGGG